MIGKKLLLTLPLFALLFSVLALTLAPGSAVASDDPFTLNTPGDYVSCTPFDVVTTSKVPAHWSVRGNATIFYVLPDGSTQFAATTGWVTSQGNLSMSVPYPSSDNWYVTDPATGMRQIVVGVTTFIYNQDGHQKKKMTAKWYVSCYP